jgi:F0F1-type ATP synthase delta subunit
MTQQAQYAKALYALVTAHPDKSAMYLENLRKTLERKGHQKLFPRIFREYETILARRERSKAYAATSAEDERTRVLLELYRTLVAS